MRHTHYVSHALCVTRIMRHKNYASHALCVTCIMSSTWFVAIKDSIYLLSITCIIRYMHSAKFSAALERYTKIYAALRPVHVVHP